MVFTQFCDFAFAASGVYVVVALVADDGEVPFDVLTTGFVGFEVMEFEEAGVIGRPKSLVPVAKAACVPVSFVHVFLDGLGDMAVVRLGDAFRGKQDVLAHAEVGVSGEARCDGVAVFGAKFT